MLMWLAGGLVVFGGAALVARVADDQGRNGGLWAVVAIAGAATSLWGMWSWLSGRALEGEELGMASVIPVVLAPVAVHVGVALLAIKLPVPVSAGGNSWPMAWLGDARDTDVSYRLELRDGAIAIAPSSQASPTTIAFGDLELVMADGECVRLRWREDAAQREALLKPLDAPPTSDGCARTAQAIAQRLVKARDAGR